MKNQETIDILEMSKAELEVTTGGLFGHGVEPLIFIIYYVTVVKVPAYFFA